MTSNDKGLLLVVSGPSGSGKGTVLGELFKSKENICYSVSATTRAPREGEVDGVNYFFISKEEFKDKINKGQMLEYAEYCGNYYGTPKDQIEKWLNEGKDVVLEIEVQGAEKVKELMPDSVSIFIMPPSLQILEKRLRGRKTEADDVISNRLETAKIEIKQSKHYNYIVVNDALECAVEDMLAIIKSEKLHSNKMIDKIKNNFREVL